MDFTCPPRLSLLCFLLFDCLIVYWDFGKGTTTTKLDALDDVICINVLDAAAAQLSCQVGDSDSPLTLSVLSLIFYR